MLFFQQAVDKIILQENVIEKLILKNETHENENTNSEIDKKELYDPDKLSLDEIE